MNELPWRCRKCSHENMVDMDSLTSWPLDKLTAARGYICEKCGSREAISFSTPLLDQSLKRLAQIRPDSRKFPYFFRKALQRAEVTNRRNYGARRHSNLAPAG